MSLFALVIRILTDHTLTTLGQEVIEREKYCVFFYDFAVYSSDILRTHDNLNVPSNMSAPLFVSTEMHPSNVAWGYGRCGEALTRTWDHFATVLRNALATIIHAHMTNLQISELRCSQDTCGQSSALLSKWSADESVLSQLPWQTSL